MKYRVKLNDSIDLIVDANSEIEAVRAAKNVKDAMSVRVADAGYLVEIATKNGVEYADQEFNYQSTTDDREDAYRFDSDLAARTWANSYKGNGVAKVVRDSARVKDADEFWFSVKLSNNVGDVGVYYYKGRNADEARRNAENDPTVSRVYAVNASGHSTKDYTAIKGGEELKRVHHDESTAEKVRKAQAWVDYDLKHYGEVSEQTKKDIAAEGLTFDKWNNQVHDAASKDEIKLYVSHLEAAILRLKSGNLGGALAFVDQVGAWLKKDLGQK